jgi:hypothetical protein
MRQNQLKILVLQETTMHQHQQEMQVAELQLRASSDK